MVWLPEIVVDNSKQGFQGLGLNDKIGYRKVRITESGTVHWSPAVYAVTECVLKGSFHFPWDSHVCKLRFTPTTTTQQQVALLPNTNSSINWEQHDQDPM